MSRNVIITGATRGLGLSLTQQFLKAGDRVFGISKTKKAWKQAEASFPQNAKITLHQVDLTHEAQVRKFRDYVTKAVPQMDILINNAGYGGRLALVTDLSVKEYEKLMHSNLTSAFLMCKHFIPVFRKQGSGLIINIASMAGKRAVPKLFGYSASKFGMVALTQCIAKENADSGFKTITVCPGGIRTEMRAALFGREDAEKQQSPGFVAGKIMDVVDDKMPLNSGANLIIRHGKIWGIDPLPGA